MNYCAVIMAGGGGTRFWPASRKSCPKQFLPIVGDKPLITATVERLEESCPTDNIFIITNTAQAAGTVELAPALPPNNIIAEPVGRNTAPCIGLAAVICQERTGEDPVMGVFPADAYITPTAEFSRTCKVAVDLAADGESIVTVGIRPSFPATGYGYIQGGDELPDCGLTARRVERFTEKPDPQTAEDFVKSGKYYWNGGIFFLRASTAFAELKRQQPEIADILEEFRPHVGSDDEKDALATAYEKMPSISFDYAVMEGARSVKVVEATFTWDDLGSWAALPRHMEADKDGNVVKGKALFVESANNTVQSKRLVAMVGVEGMVVVETGDAILVCPRERAEEVKKIVENLRAEGRSEYL